MNKLLCSKDEMKEYLRKKHYRYIRSSSLMKATALKYSFSIIIIILSILWLATSGFEMMLAQQEMQDPNPSRFLIVMWPLVPYLKLGTIFIGYLSLVTPSYYYFRSLKRKVEKRNRVLGLIKLKKKLRH